MTLVEKLKWESLIGGGGGQWTTDGIADCSEPNGEITLNVDFIQNYALYWRTGITCINAPNVWGIGISALNHCESLKTLNAPNLASVAQNAFCYTSIEELCINAVKTGLSYGALADARKLKKIDIGGVPGSIQGATFQNCVELSMIILRPENGVSLTHVNAFDGTPFASGGSGGEIYIPKALLDSGWYTTATNWSVINEYGTITWKAIEGSEYE